MTDRQDTSHDYVRVLNVVGFGGVYPGSLAVISADCLQLMMPLCVLGAAIALAWPDLLSGVGRV